MYLQPLLRNPARKLPNLIKITQPLGLLRRSESFKVIDFGSNRKLICDFLLVINSNLYHILHRFRDICLRKIQNRYISLPVLPLTPDAGVPCDDLRKTFHRKVRDGQGIKWRRNITNGLLDPEGNYVIRLDRRCSVGGGVCVAVRRGLTCTEVHCDDDADGVEMLMLCVDVLCERSLFRFIVIYRPPQYGIEAREYANN